MNDERRIKVQPNGPYVVQGRVPLRRTHELRSEHGEPMTWQTTERLGDRPVVALCRCGGSADKPYCDGSEAAPTSTYEERATSYEGTGVVVRDDRGICEHAGFCGNRLTNVWKMVAGATTDGADDTIARAQMMAMIEHCPSGALTFRRDTDGADVEPPLAAAIGVVDDGPLFVTGGVTVERSDSKPFEARNRMTLCRCGGSSIKPLCDGTHRDNGFHDPATSG